MQPECGGKKVCPTGIRDEREALLCPDPGSSCCPQWFQHTSTLIKSLGGDQEEAHCSVHRPQWLHWMFGIHTPQHSSCGTFPKEQSVETLEHLHLWWTTVHGQVLCKKGLIDCTKVAKCLWTFRATAVYSSSKCKTMYSILSFSKPYVSNQKYNKQHDTGPHCNYLRCLGTF